MIRSFKHRGLKRLFERDDRSGIRPDLVDTVQEMLTALDDAVTPQELNLPGYRLHPLRRFEGVVVRDGTGQLAHHFSF
jgi:proteic killer suppression protein